MAQLEHFYATPVLKSFCTIPYKVKKLRSPAPPMGPVKRAVATFDLATLLASNSLIFLPMLAKVWLAML